MALGHAAMFPIAYRLGRKAPLSVGIMIRKLTACHRGASMKGFNEGDVWSCSDWTCHVFANG